MRSIERTRLDIRSRRKDDFPPRDHELHRARDRGPAFDYKDPTTRLHKALEGKLFEDQQATRSVTSLVFRPFFGRRRPRHAAKSMS